MIVDRSTRRRLRAESYGDWLGVPYRVVLYMLAATPAWGAALMVAIVWHRTHL
jgi:hypothetical protein